MAAVFLPGRCHMEWNHAVLEVLDFLHEHKGKGIDERESVIRGLEAALENLRDGENI